MKTRKEVLEVDYDSALTQLIENEINIRALEARVITTPPGAEYTKIQSALLEKKNNVEQIKKILDIILTMVAEEEKACKNLN
jgi:hypothetical protein